MLVNESMTLAPTDNVVGLASPVGVVSSLTFSRVRNEQEAK